jgi:putative membrane protein
MILDKGIPARYILRKIRNEAIIVTIIGVIAYYITNAFEDKLPQMPITIPAFLGTAISIILSFKLNQSYDRWWEARKIWGNIVNDSRTLILQLQSFLRDDNRDAVRKITFRHIAWCFSLGQSLRGLNPVADLQKYMSDEEIDTISRHQNKPLAILQLNSQHIRALKSEEQLDIFSYVQINNTLVNFTNAMGMAERIKSTIFPATYRLFLHMFIYLFVITLSISLTDIQGYLEIPLLLVISSAFFLLERTATHLQDPFSNRPTDTAMTAIALTIETNLKQLIGENEIPRPQQPEEFYLM